MAPSSLSDVNALSGAYGRLQSFQYREVESLSERLASCLEERFGRSGLREMTFQAVPRGGLFILGYLSYFLDLTHTQFLPSPGKPVVLVDDCSISGARFWRWRRENPQPVAFAPLLSHPSLRAAIEREEGVLGCWSAADLQDLSGELYPDPEEHAAWRQRCSTRLGEGRYWIGVPERIAFPWTEPDTIHWDRVSGQAEPGWRLASPDCCLHNRQSFGLPLRPDIRRHLRVPDLVAYRSAADGVTLCDLRSERCYGLRGAAAEMWRALAVYGEQDAAAAHVATRYAIPLKDAEADTRRFADELLSRGLLESANTPTLQQG